MSRRRAFETSLGNSSTPTSAPPSSAPSQPKSKSSQKTNQDLPPAVTPPNAEHPSAQVPTETTEEKELEVEAASPSEGEEVDDSVQCFICAEPITFWGVGVCGHRTCHVCAVRLRVFYKKTDCTFCKTPLPSLLFSRSPDSPFPTENHIPPSSANRIAAAHATADKLKEGERWDKGLTLPGTLDLSKFLFSDDKLNVIFEDEDMMEKTLLLLRFNCPYPDCPHMGTNWDTLEKHTLKVHGLVFCRICRSKLSRFAHEQILYPPHLLCLHDPSRLQRGQKPPRPRGEKEIELVKTWEAPHPICEFCHEAFFGPDELFKHMRSRHEECFVCKDQGQRDVYFKNYDALEQHFNKDHFPCTQPICLEKKFVVFGSQVDLQAHVVKEHSESMSNRDRALARQLQVEFTSVNPRSSRSNQPTPRGFTLAPTHQSGSSGPSRRDAPPHQQISPPPMNSVQAAQHQRQVQNDRQEENRRRRGFVTELSEGNSSGSGTNGHGNGRRGGDISGSGFNTPREDEVDDPTAARHAALLSRVSMLVSDSNVKLSSFRSAVRQFRSNESGAKDMLDTIFHVLDRDVEATTGVVREIASLFDGEGEGDKRTAVLEALNGFRAEQREQFPSLGGSSGPDYANIAAGQILFAKRATQTSSRGGTSRAVWERVEAAASSHPVARPTHPSKAVNARSIPGAISNTSAFPSLASSSIVAGPSSRVGLPHSTPWAGGGGGGGGSKPVSVLTGPVIRSVNYPLAPTKTKPLNNNSFPSLPPSSGNRITAEEKKKLFAKPTPREESIRRITGQDNVVPKPVNGWGGVVGGMERMEMDDENVIASEGSVTNGGGQGGAGKKKGKQKQLLFSVSARP